MPTRSYDRKVLCLYPFCRFGRCPKPQTRGFGVENSSFDSFTTDSSSSQPSRYDDWRGSLFTSRSSAGALERYQTCRMPHWQGLWFPLPSEVEFLWHNSAYLAPMRGFVTRHIVLQLLTQRYQTNLADIAVLLSCNIGLILDVLRSVRRHLTDEIGATESCGVGYCAHYLQVWTQSDVDEATVRVRVLRPDRAVAKDV